MRSLSSSLSVRTGTRKMRPSAVTIASLDWLISSGTIGRRQRSANDLLGLLGLQLKQRVRVIDQVLERGHQLGPLLVGSLVLQRGNQIVALLDQLAHELLGRTRELVVTR